MELETLIAECTAYDYKDTLEEKKPKRDKDELKPMFKSTPTQFQTTIYASSDEPEIEDVPKDVPKELSERQNIILDLIKENPLVTIPEMSLKTGVVARTVKRDIEYLQAKGVIVRKGGRKEGYWKILKSE